MPQCMGSSSSDTTISRYKVKGCDQPGTVKHADRDTGKKAETQLFSSRPEGAIRFDNFVAQDARINAVLTFPLHSAQRASHSSSSPCRVLGTDRDVIMHMRSIGGSYASLTKAPRPCSLPASAYVTHISPCKKPSGPDLVLRARNIPMKFCTTCFHSKTVANPGLPVRGWFIIVLGLSSLPILLRSMVISVSFSNTSQARPTCELSAEGFLHSAFLHKIRYRMLEVFDLRNGNVRHSSLTHA